MSTFYILNYRHCVYMKNFLSPKDTLNLKLYQCLRNHFKYSEKQNPKNSGLCFLEVAWHGQHLAIMVLSGPHGLRILAIDFSGKVEPTWASLTF